MCGIKDKAGYIIQCKISDIPLVSKTGAATVGRPPVPIIFWCHDYKYRSLVVLIIILLVLFFSISNSEPFLNFIKLSFDLRILMGVCSICLHIFSNSWCSFGGGVNEMMKEFLQGKRLGSLNF